jgi:hypothetical protein
MLHGSDEGKISECIHKVNRGEIILFNALYLCLSFLADNPVEYQGDRSQYALHVISWILVLILSIGM